LLLQHRLRDVVERHDAEQRRAVHHRHVARVALEHRAAQVHDVEARRGGQRIAREDVGHRDVAERAAPIRERAQHLGERQDAGQPAVVHDDERADVVLGHHLDRFEHRALGRRREQRVPLMRRISLTSMATSCRPCELRGYSRGNPGGQRSARSDNADSRSPGRVKPRHRARSSSGRFGAACDTR
jgi:hypothetical protein